MTFWGQECKYSVVFFPKSTAIKLGTHHLCVHINSNLPDCVAILIQVMVVGGGVMVKNPKKRTMKDKKVGPEKKIFV